MIFLSKMRHAVLALTLVLAGSAGVLRASYAAPQAQQDDAAAHDSGSKANSDKSKDADKRDDNDAPLPASVMAVMNNWDLKDVNNSVDSDKETGSQIFLVNDPGATFGANGVTFTRARSKGNIDSFRDSKFINRLTSTEVDFSTPKALPVS